MFAEYVQWLTPVRSRLDADWKPCNLSLWHSFNPVQIVLLPVQSQSVASKSCRTSFSGKRICKKKNISYTNAIWLLNDISLCYLSQCSNTKYHHMFLFFILVPLFSIKSTKKKRTTKFQFIYICVCFEQQFKIYLK